jgi:hypothetical protein
MVRLNAAADAVLTLGQVKQISERISGARCAAK